MIHFRHRPVQPGPNQPNQCGTPPEMGPPIHARWDKHPKPTGWLDASPAGLEGPVWEVYERCKHEENLGEFVCNSKRWILQRGQCGTLPGMRPLIHAIWDKHPKPTGWLDQRPGWRGRCMSDVNMKRIWVSWCVTQRGGCYSVASAGPSRG
jgi:hypothetical protein